MEAERIGKYMVRPVLALEMLEEEFPRVPSNGWAEPDSGLVRPIFCLPRRRAAGSRVLDSCFRPRYLTFRDEKG
jgi:hypothetical protein